MKDAFSVLTLLVGWETEKASATVKELSVSMLVAVIWAQLQSSIYHHSPTPSSLAAAKSRMVWYSATSLPRLSRSCKPKTSVVSNKLCESRHNMPRPSPPSVGAEAPRAAEPTSPADRNVAVGSHAQYVPTVTAAAAWRVNAAVSKAAWWPWPLTFWSWKWCPGHVWRGLPLCQF